MVKLNEIKYARLLDGTCNASVKNRSSIFKHTSKLLLDHYVVSATRKPYIFAKQNQRNSKRGESNLVLLSGDINMYNPMYQKMIYHPSVKNWFVIAVGAVVVVAFITVSFDLIVDAVFVVIGITCSA
jgi:hypothetical protein